MIVPRKAIASDWARPSKIPWKSQERKSFQTTICPSTMLILVKPEVSFAKVTPNSQAQNRP